MNVRGERERSTPIIGSYITPVVGQEPERDGRRAECRSWAIRGECRGGERIYTICNNQDDNEQSYEQVQEVISGGMMNNSVGY